MHYYKINNFFEWRNEAKILLANQILPHDVTWQQHNTEQNSLFETSAASSHVVSASTHSVPKVFLELAKIVACHQSIRKWGMLYECLWRLTHGEKYLLQIASDPLVNQLFLYKKAVMRDAHKMKAFVRFRRYLEEGEEYYIAWYQPDHDIIKLIAPFFQKRFQVMQWMIMTPYETVAWDREVLTFKPGIKIKPALEDDVENLWLTYYRSTFNPARLKLKAMRNEMPVRYWHTMPETQLISQLIQEAPARAAKMLNEQEGFSQSAKDFIPSHVQDISALAEASKNCRACTLYQCARQTVFGKGLDNAKVMLVGEQPGLQEDIKGEPFVGPAGELLRSVLHDINVDINTLYVTNVVKHFKHTVSKGKQLHRSPDIKEVNACRPWLDKEIELIKPKLIICLGNTAAKALIQPGFAMTRQRGEYFHHSSMTLTATYHPSAILRMPDIIKKQEIKANLKSDLEKALMTIL